jgi:uncharacterized protein (TIGR00304 family)
VKLESSLADNVIFTIGLLLVIAGFVIAVLVSFLAILRSMKGGEKMRGGGVVMIGPVPIVFGTDKGSTRTLLLLGIILMILFLVLTILSTLWR